ncbi:hypothetical protein RchiOBHm_Chr2g0114681 [Rosa chinensis]|uniref:Uncharacterized protein n=1 Tax=Rosa chinensis TaxID=74649 RepID=A0A2P6RQR7_ROSCH|nr:hypothetical protein RchiOBHm_Chr2g0114681 [Rosa chinensis]
MVFDLGQATTISSLESLFMDSGARRCCWLVLSVRPGWWCFLASGGAPKFGGAERLASGAIRRWLSGAFGRRRISRWLWSAELWQRWFFGGELSTVAPWLAVALSGRHQPIMDGGALG